MNSKQEDNIETVAGITEMCYNNLQLLKKYNEPFRRIFGMRLTTFWTNNLLGFDIVKFDKALNTPDGTSMSDFLLEKYGKEGRNIVMGLLCIREDMDDAN